MKCCVKIESIITSILHINTMKNFRIHGDNIVECERMADIVIDAAKVKEKKVKLASPSALIIEITSYIDNEETQWSLELLPGFNKNSKHRWEYDIFDPLKKAGSFHDETPDVVVTETKGDKETILFCVEFCSALQAGNQAWQRSARAYSVSRTGCPYLYVVDFVKYELDNKTRKRKNLRFPNAAVPYSYLNYADDNRFIAQVYTKSEEFDKNKDRAIKGFDDSNFGQDSLGEYIYQKMFKHDTSEIENDLLRKNLKTVMFLSDKNDAKRNFTSSEWEQLYNSGNKNVAQFSVNNSRLKFHKTVAQKSVHGKTKAFIELVEKYATGLSSKDLPICVIAKNKKQQFLIDLAKLYPSFSEELLKKISKTRNDLIVAIFKGFKPRGDDNRPDRGLLPLAKMLAPEEADIVTFIYGPILYTNFVLLDRNPGELSQRNGLWRSILSLSDLVIIDSPILHGPKKDACVLYSTAATKSKEIYLSNKKPSFESKFFDNRPSSYGEDDVDTALHYLFSHILKKNCFEGMCNPPGGDWSGFSLIKDDKELRWVSLPRVSDIVDGKRPDHIIEFNVDNDTPTLLSIESKEKSIDLENNVGEKLVNYIKSLLGYIPSAERKRNEDSWSWATEKVDPNGFEILSAAAYLKEHAQNDKEVYEKNCEMLFILDPFSTGKQAGWIIDIKTETQRGIELKEKIKNIVSNIPESQIIIK